MVVNGVEYSWWLVFGPLLFNIFMNDLDQAIDCFLSRFVDDSKLSESTQICFKVGRLCREI